jgi:hypothetical protein
MQQALGVRQLKVSNARMIVVLEGQAGPVGPALIGTGKGVEAEQALVRSQHDRWHKVQPLVQVNLQAGLHVLLGVQARLDRLAPRGWNFPSGRRHCRYIKSHVVESLFGKNRSERNRLPRGSANCNKPPLCLRRSPPRDGARP